MRRTAVLLLVVAALASLSSAGAQDPTLERRIRLLESQVEELTRQVGTLRSAVRVDAAGVQITSPGTLRVQAAATLDLQGAILRLNGGGRVLLTPSTPIGAGLVVGTATQGACVANSALSTNPVSTVLVP
jgi:hypothetical protein